MKGGCLLQILRLRRGTYLKRHAYLKLGSDLSIYSAEEMIALTKSEGFSYRIYSNKHRPSNKRRIWDRKVNTIKITRVVKCTR